MTVATMTRTEKEMAPHKKQEVSGAEGTRPGRMFAPPVDISESDEAIVVYADMPGVSPDGLTIDLRENVLSIDGHVQDVALKDEEVFLREYETGSFRREFRLTNLIDQERIDATLRDGVLKLTLPKADAARPRRIQVRTD